MVHQEGMHRLSGTTLTGKQQGETILPVFATAPECLVHCAKSLAGALYYQSFHEGKKNPGKTFTLNKEGRSIFLLPDYKGMFAVKASPDEARPLPPEFAGWDNAQQDRPDSHPPGTRWL